MVGPRTPLGALAPLLGAEHRAVLLHQRGVPARREGDRRGQLGDAGGAVADADRAVLQVQGGDAERGCRRDVPDIARRAGREPGAVDHGELVVEGHLG